MRGTFALTHAAMPHLRPGGSVLVISSITAWKGFPGGTSYATTKAAVCSLMECLYGQLRDLPDIAPPEVLDRTTSGTRITLAVRYVFTGKVDPIVKRLVKIDQLVWVQTTEFDTSAHEASLTVVPEKLGSMLQCSGRFDLTAAPGGGTVRTLSGELKVKVPLLGGRAEKALGPGILRRIDLEADALRTWLQVGRA